MKLHYILPTVMMLGLMAASCVEDESAYEAQPKEDVVVDPTEGGQNGEEQEYPDGVLVPGIHQVSLNVTLPDNTVEERRFKYFMPISIDETKPISLIFEFHGSYTFDEGVTPPNPIKDISQSHALNQLAIQENCVVCFPAGAVEMKEDTSGAVNWQNSDRNLPFVDAMIEWFKNQSPTIDTDRIYSTGQSSGAIFSFVLAFERSEVFAAITPRAGQMNIDNQTTLPVRAVPVRVFAGIDDDIVIHSAVINNMTTWAEKIGGYFASDMALTPDSIEIENAFTIDTRIWEGARTDLQIFSLHETGHGVPVGLMTPYMWEFMQSHTLGNHAGGLYVNCSLGEIDAMCGEKFSFKVSYSDGARLDVTAPKGWTMVQDDKDFTLTAPTDFYASVARQGNLKFTVTKDGATAVKEVPFKLNAPKDYFEVGELYYNADFKPVGVVCWVNDDNIREAKIISLQEVTSQGNYKDIYYGNFGVDFTTPSSDDGEGNTSATVSQNSTLAKPLNEVGSVVIWAANYSYNGTDGWYLPALDEMKAVYENRNAINDAIKSAGGESLGLKGYNYHTSTVTLENNAKCFHIINLNTGAVTTKSGTEPGYNYGRAMKKVHK